METKLLKMEDNYRRKQIREFYQEIRKIMTMQRRNVQEKRKQ